MCLGQLNINIKISKIIEKVDCKIIEKVDCKTEDTRLTKRNKSIIH